MGKLEKWLEKNKPLKRKSNLFEYQNEITRLNELGYTQNQIAEYLKEVCQTETTQQNLSRFLKEPKKEPMKVVKESHKVVEEKAKNSDLDNYFAKYK
ncbi:hypothetical protein [Sulfurimonas sp.]|uniref:hypothetical protein n=1 Tax=Sulfurimonas sp. TaxID=2022749 RepID=UPI0025F22449|nr:hypothetical protein [Sulfurimonas sp.]MCK9454232.1 hypothetical protein [Sulfurimonas sp.]